MTIFTTIRLFLFSVLIVIYNHSFSQYNFQKTYKGLIFNTGQITAEGGYIATGSTRAYGAGSNDFFLLKLNPLGVTEWLKTYGSNGNESAYDIRQTYDGGYIISGTTYGFGVGAEFYVVKTDSNGDTLWTRAYGSTNDETGFSVEQTLDSGFIFCGQTQISLYNKDIFFYKTDKSGNLQWSKTFGGINDDVSYSIKKTKDNNFIIIGATMSFGPELVGENLLLIKINNNGDTLWSKVYNCYQNQSGINLIETSDGGLILVSTIWGFGAGAQDIFILKTNSTGEVIWAKTYGTLFDEYSSSILQTSDGGYIFTGSSDSTGPGIDIYTVRLNSFGDTLWTRVYSRSTQVDWGTAIEQTADGGFIIFASSSNWSGGNSFSHLIKTDKDALAS